MLLYEHGFVQDLFFEAIQRYFIIEIFFYIFEHYSYIYFQIIILFFIFILFTIFYFLHFPFYKISFFIQFTIFSYYFYSQILNSIIYFLQELSIIGKDKMKKINIVDVNNYLFLQIPQQPSKDSTQYFRQLCKSNNTNSMGTFGSQQLQRGVSQPLHKGLSRSNSIKHTKKSKLMYEIMDNKKIVLYRNPTAANSYNFDHIEEFKSQSNYLVNWVYSSLKNMVSLQNNNCQQQASYKLNCKFILANNYQMKDCFNLLTMIGKKLIHEGFIFRIKTKYERIQSDSLINNKLCGQRKSTNKINSNVAQSQMSKNIKYTSQLKQYVNSLKFVCSSIQQVWIIFNFLQIGIGVSQPKKNNYSLKLLEKLISQCNNNFNENKDKIKRDQPDCFNINIAISSICNIPQQNNLQNCKRIFQESITLKNNINEYAILQKPFYSFKSENNDSDQGRRLSKNESNAHISSYSRALRQCQNILKSKQERKKSRKSSKLDSNRKEIQSIQNRRQNSKAKKFEQKYKQEESQLSSEQQQLLSVSGKSVKQNNNLSNSENNINTMAENMHLKWQLKAMQQQYQLQSQKFIIKTEKKYKDMLQQRTFCLQQNGRLRKDNQQLLKELTIIKQQYQEILKTRTDYQVNLHQKNKESQLMIEKNYLLQIKQLQQKLRTTELQNKGLQKNYNQLKLTFQDSKRRYKERIREMTEQLENYQKFCEEFKVAYDQLQSQARLDQDRCLNLQKRCKKYQESLSDLLKLKTSNQSSLNNSRYSQAQSNQIIDKAYQIMNQKQQRQFTLRNKQEQKQQSSTKQQQQPQRQITMKKPTQEQKIKKFNEYSLQSQLKQKLSIKRESKSDSQKNKFKNNKKNEQQLNKQQFQDSNFNLEFNQSRCKKSKNQRLVSFGDSWNKIK